MDRKRDLVSIECLLTRGAWAVLRRECPHDGRGVDITGSPWYMVVRLMLRREEVTRAGYAGVTITDAEPGKLLVTTDDMRRLGHYISIDRMAQLNNAILQREREKICEEVRMAKVFGGLPRDTAIDYFLLKHGMDEVIKFAALRKWYQRRYAETEEAYAKDYQHIMQWKAGQNRNK